MTGVNKVIVLALSVVFLIGCEGSGDVNSGSNDRSRSALPSTAGSPLDRTTSAAPVAPSRNGSLTPVLTGRPKTGSCYDPGRTAFSQQRDGSSPVSCAKPHTAETFAVFSVGSSPSPSMIDRTWRVCQRRFTHYVGGSSTISKLGLTVILPSVEQVGGGQHWVRCDAIEQSRYNGVRGLRRQRSVRGALAGGAPVSLRGCVQHWPKPGQPVRYRSCHRRHQAELIPQSLNLGGPSTPFPGVMRSKNRSKAFCESTFQDYVSQTHDYAFYFPTRASWRSGSHDTTCWALDTSRGGLPPL